jgi:D-alanyl-D-alanine carboxypeptidase/D-alanyl-D-alanine-endopeptidase (penicillin-binding protein 4)
MNTPINPLRKSQRVRSFFTKAAHVLWLPAVFLASGSLEPTVSWAGQSFPCLRGGVSSDAFLVADKVGRVLHGKNEARRYVPASTLKILTALAALHHLGPSYCFSTEFYTDSDGNLKIKGYGDPLLISEALKEISKALAIKVPVFQDLGLDDTYFAPDITIPGRNRSTNPYDAPVGALCANFNTIFFRRNKGGKIVSAESQTPMIPYAREKARSLGLRKGRYTFTHDRREAARYTGELLLHFLKEQGVRSQGELRLSAVTPGDRLIHTYRSMFTLEQAIKKMMGSSNNFMANQIFIALGARAFGPPGTLAKGVKAVSQYAANKLGLEGAKIVEGSGISRKNSLSPLHMMTVLGHFKPYRRLLRKQGQVRYKTGSLRGIRALAGYIAGPSEEGPDRFVIFLKRANIRFSSLIRCVGRFVHKKRRDSQ